MSCPGCSDIGSHTYSISNCQLARVNDYYGDRWGNDSAENEDDK